MAFKRPYVLGRGSQTRKYRLFALFVQFNVVIAISACASLNSTAEKVGDTAPVRDGVGYYMPMQPFKITVTLDANSVPTVSVTAGDAVPDLTRRFTLQYGQNYFGTNHAVLSVNSKGLLESANNGTTSATSTLATDIGTLAGTLAAAAAAAAGAPKAPAPPPASPCKASQTYVVIEFPENLSPSPTPIVCNLLVAAAAVAPKGRPIVNPADTKRLADVGTAQSGFFYKRDLPYLITVTDTGANTLGQWLAYSPDQSEIDFYATTPTLFANSQTNITMTDGTLTQVDQSTDSELVGFVQIPANIISGYTSALGNIFGSLNTAKTNQNNLQGSDRSLLVSQVKLEACKAAIASNDPASKTGADLTAAVAAIQAACQ